MDNPKAAIDSVLETERTIGGQTVYPLTLGRYALLELVESPFVTNGVKFTTLNMIPTFYIMTHEVKDVSKYNSSNIDELKAKALEWADSKEMQDTADLVNEMMRKFGLLDKVKPESSDGQDGQKKIV